MFTEKVTTQDEAVAHLFFHCCLKDGRFDKSEIDLVAGQLVTAGLHERLNFKDEVIKYRAYRDSITDDAEYVRHLKQLINAVNELALYAYCVDLCIADAELSTEEEKLLGTIASALNVSGAEQNCVRKLAAQRKVIETQKLF